MFDDVTPGVFPGVVEAVEKIRSLGSYEIVKLGREQERGYALARRLWTLMSLLGSMASPKQRGFDLFIRSGISD